MVYLGDPVPSTHVGNSFKTLTIKVSKHRKLGLPSIALDSIAVVVVQRAHLVRTGGDGEQALNESISRTRSLVTNDDTLGLDA